MVCDKKVIFECQYCHAKFYVEIKRLIGTKTMVCPECGRIFVDFTIRNTIDANLDVDERLRAWGY